MTCDEFISAFFETFRQGMSCKKLANGRFSVVLPFLYPDHDNVEMFVREFGDDVVVSDLGETLRRLDTIGMNIQASGKFAYQAERISSGFNVAIEKGVLCKRGTRQELGTLFFDVLSASMAIGDLAFGSRGYQPLTFIDEVAKVLLINAFDFEKRHEIRGKTTTQYHVDFQVKAPHRVSLVQALGARSQAGVRKWVNATYRMWNDVEIGAGLVVRKVSLLNDEVTKVKPEDESLLKSVSDVYRWTERQQVLTALRNGVSVLN